MRPAPLPFSREAAIAERAHAIAGTHFPGGRVEPEAIATHEHIRFRYAAFPEEFDGILLHEAGEFFLVCNERRAPRGSARSRFTFAHELGHYFIPEHRVALASGRIPAHFSLAEYASHQPIEREADTFAANLLMPPAAFRSRASAIPRGLPQITALAEFFGTSLTATAFRALQLELFPAPAALFRWNLDGELAGRRLSWDTFHLGADYRKATGRPPPGSATASAIQADSPQTHHAASDCPTWFPCLHEQGNVANLRLREEVMSLGRFGWLTLLYRDDIGG